MVGYWAIRLLAAGQAAVAALAMSATTSLGAEITGETHAPPVPQEGLEIPAGSSASPGEPGVGRTVIDISIMPDPNDPTKVETQVWVRRKAGREICLALRSDDVISRSYQPRGEEPFTPLVGAKLRAQTSGQSADLVGFNELKVFLKPDSPEFTFALNECFVVGSYSGCFVEDFDPCDVHLEEDAEICVSGTLSGTACVGADHAGAFDIFSKMLAANESAIITTEAGPIEVGAGDVVQAPEVGGIFQPPSGTAPPLVTPPTVTDPVTGGVVGGGGGGTGPELTQVPNLIGLTDAQATIALENAFLGRGTVTLEGGGVVTHNFSLIRSAQAQAFTAGQCVVPIVDPGQVCAQCLPAGTDVPITEPPFKCDYVLKRQVAIPEPAVLPIFLAGLVLLLLVVWRSRTGAWSS